jgi:hypothetical protein
MGLVERVTGFYRRISDKPPNNKTTQAKPMRAEIREIKERRSRKIRRVKPTERIEPKPRTQDIKTVEQPKPKPEEPKTITDEEFKELIADLPPKRKERILKDYERAKEMGGQITIIEGEAPNVTQKLIPTPKDIEREKKLQEDYESLSPAVKMFVDEDDETKNVSVIAENERTLRKQSALYEAGYQVGKFSESTSKFVEEKLPLEHLGPVGTGVERGIAGLAAGLPFLGSVALQAGGLVEAKVKGVESDLTVQDIGAELKEMGQSEAHRFQENPVEVGAEYATLALAPFTLKGARFLARKAPVRIPTPVRQTVLKGAVITEVEAKTRGSGSIREVKAGRIIADDSLTDIAGVVKEDLFKIEPEVYAREVKLIKEKRWKLRGSEEAKDTSDKVRTYASVELREFSDVGTKYSIEGIGEIEATLTAKPSEIGKVPRSASETSQALEFTGGKIPNLEVMDIATTPKEFLKLTGTEATAEVLTRMKGSKGIVFEGEPGLTMRQYKITFEREIARDIFKEQGRKAGMEVPETIEPGLLDRLKLRKPKEVVMEDRVKRKSSPMERFEELADIKDIEENIGMRGKGNKGGRIELVEKGGERGKEKGRVELVEEIILEEEPITDIFPGLKALPVMKTTEPTKSIDREVKGIGMEKGLVATSFDLRLEHVLRRKEGIFDLTGEDVGGRTGEGVIGIPIVDVSEKGATLQKMIQENFTTDIYDIPEEPVVEVPVTPGFPIPGGIGAPIFPPVPGSGLEALDYYSDWWKYRERELTLSAFEILTGGRNARKNKDLDEILL